MTYLITAMLAYLIGSISFAVLTSKCFHLPDPHSYGSGNPGATNVLRSGNKLAAMLTLLGDGAKGALAVWLAQRFLLAPIEQPLGLAIAALAVFLGHIFPVYHRFQGGKGVATAAGILCIVDWRIALICTLIWLIAAFVFKISSLGALIAAIAAPVAAYYFWGQTPISATLVMICLLLIWRHKSNIQKLLSGRETTIGQ